MPEAVFQSAFSPISHNNLRDHHDRYLASLLAVIAQSIITRRDFVKRKRNTRPGSVSKTSPTVEEIPPSNTGTILLPLKPRLKLPLYAPSASYHTSDGVECKRSLPGFSTGLHSHSEQPMGSSRYRNHGLWLCCNPPYTNRPLLDYQASPPPF